MTQHYKDSLLPPSSPTPPISSLYQASTPTLPSMSGCVVVVVVVVVVIVVVVIIVVVVVVVVVVSFQISKWSGRVSCAHLKVCRGRGRARVIPYCKG